ncbi:MAG TPA: OmpA family protein [Polyangiaceae bacterium]
MNYRMSITAPLAFGLAACAGSQPSAELEDARSTYAAVQASEANAYAPAQVMSAKQALDRAEQAYEDDAGSFREKSLAYVAKRQAEIAAARADIIKAQRQEEAAEASYIQRQQQLRADAEQRLESTQGDLASSRRELALQATQIQEERQARLAAEQRAERALESLREVAQVKEESRGTTITLDGAVLFATGKSELLSLAKHKLDQVSEVLKEVPEEQSILVEGHTDSRGADSMNQELSQGRANAVRSYLVSRGIAAEQIRAVGKGEEQPLTTNDTAEGRANNRRVEIVIERRREQPSSQAGQQQSTSPSAKQPSPGAQSR